MSKIYANENGFWVDRGERGRVWAGQLDWPTSDLGMTDDEKKEVDEYRAYYGYFPVRIKTVLKESSTDPIIWKYPLQTVDEQTIEVPRGAKFLSAQFQDASLCMWALVNVNNPKVKVRVVVGGTGQPLPISLPPFVGTVQAEVVGGKTSMGIKFAVLRVWHVFAGEAS